MKSEAHQLDLFDLNQHEPVRVEEIVDCIENFDLTPDPRYLDDEHKVIDFDAARLRIEFIGHCEELLDLVDKERVNQGKAPYDNSQRRILVRQLYVLASLFKEQFRKSGDSVFGNHLIGAMKNLVKYLGLTGLVSILAVAFHDVEEDICEKHPAYACYKDDKSTFWADLPKPQEYADELEGFDVATMNEALGIVRLIVRSVTKVRSSYKSTPADETFALLLEGFLDDVRSVYVKLADRIHNMETLSGHKDEAKRIKIARETLDVYVPCAKIIKAQDALRRLVELVLEILNKDLIEYYRGLVNTRVSALLGEVSEIDEHGEISFDSLNVRRGVVFQRITDIEGVSDIKFVARSIADYVDHEEMAKLSPEEMRRKRMVPKHDLMFEIVVTVDNESGDLDETVQKRISRVVREIDGSFVDGSQASVQVEKKDLVDGSGIHRGIELSVLDPEIAPVPFVIRVNDAHSEARIKRGIVATRDRNPSHRCAPPKILRNRALEVLNNGDNVLQTAAEKLFKSEVTVLTPRGELRDFPRGATVLDFAASVHDDFLIGLQSVSLRNGLHINRASRPIPLLDELSHGRVYDLETSLKRGDEPDYEDLKLNPSWYEFVVTSEAEKGLRSYFRGMDVEDVVGLGMEYVCELADLFGLSKDQFFEILSDKFEASQGKVFSDESDDLKSRIADLELGEKIFYAVGLGRLSPLKTFAEYAAHSQLGDVEVDIPNIERTFARLSNEFGRQGVNIDLLREHVRGKGVGADRLDTLRFVPECSAGKMYDICKILLKLREEDWVHRVRVVDSPVYWVNISELRVMARHYESLWPRVHIAFEKNGIDLSDPDLEEVRYDKVLQALDAMEVYLSQKKRRVLFDRENKGYEGGDLYEIAEVMDVVASFRDDYISSFSRDRKTFVDSAMVRFAGAFRELVPAQVRAEMRDRVPTGLVTAAKRVLPARVIGGVRRAFLAAGV